jgi:hypothetical protein
MIEGMPESTPTAVKAKTVLQDVKRLTEADCWFIIEEVKNHPLLWNMLNESLKNITNVTKN